MTPFAPRWLEIAGAHNVRDVGGLPAGAYVTKPGVLIRGDNLDDITDDGLAAVVDGLQLGSIIDLRTEDEAPEPHARLGAAGVAQLHIPLIDLSGETSPSALRVKYGDNAPQIYQHMLEEAGPAFRPILAFALADGHLPTFVHCAAGKDRTGITVAVLLAVAGVEQSAIVADYVATAERLERVRNSLRRKAVYQAMNLPEAPLEVPAGPIEGVLDALRTEPGGVDGFLVRHGVEPEAISRWREAILTPAG